MPRLKAVARFLGCFVVYYGLLIAPWPGWNAVYGRGFRALNQAVFASNQHRILRFEATDRFRRPIDTQITLANLDRTDAQGHAPGRRLGLDSRGVGWVPTALLIALVLASPVGWRRRGGALLVGLALVQVFILFSVGCYIWSEASELGLLALAPWEKSVADGLVETLVTQLGASFVVPALLWLLVTFRIEELTERFGLSGAGRGPDNS